MSARPYEECAICQAYAARRHKVLIPAMVDVKARTGEAPQDIIDRYFDGVHARHLAGGSL